jgi:hypothetical protein
MRYITVVLKYVGLFAVLFLAVKVVNKIDEWMGESFNRKEKLKNFHSILPELDSCWNPHTKLTFFLACASGDAQLQDEVAFYLTNCFLEKNNLPVITCKNSLKHIFCHPSTCPQSCGQENSAWYSAQFGFNAFEVIQTGIKDSVCKSTSVMDDERIWNLRINWEEIMGSLSTAGAGTKHAVTIVEHPAEKIKALKMILRHVLYRQWLST